MRRPRSLIAALISVALAVAGAVALTFAAAPPATALDNGLAQTPPMGFNDWNAFGCNVDEQLIKQTADFFVSSGLKDAGYKYVNIDDCWLEKTRSADGHLVPDPVKFPDGIKGTADYVHSRGLKLGIYEDAGTRTCAGYPGSYGHETTDAQDFADWGVDYLKYDNCNLVPGTGDNQQEYIDRYKRMRDALAATGRPIVFSLCEWGNFQPWTWGADVGNLWRTTGDIGDNWGSLKSIIAQNAQLAQYAHPGAWNDPDMLEVGNGGMTDTEYKTHFGLWAEMSAPLLIGSDLRKATPKTLAILGNRDVIAVDQDPLGVQGKVIAQDDGTMVFNKPLANGDRAVALYNSNDKAATVSVTAAQTGLPRAPAYTLKDLWTGTTTETAGAIDATVPAHGTVLYRVAASHDWANYAPATSFDVASSSVPFTINDSDVVTEAQAGGTAAFTYTLANYGKVPLENVQVMPAAPAGWSVTPTSPSRKGSLGSNGTFSTSWSLQVPPDTSPGAYPLAVHVTYTYAEATRSGTASSSGIVPVVLPPPSGTTPLSDVARVSEANGCGPLVKDQSNGGCSGAGQPLTIRGHVYPKGLGAHAPSDIVYYLGGNCSSLTSDVGIDDEVNGEGEVTFQVFADDAKVADSGAVTGTSPVVNLSADLSGATWLRLHIDPDGANFFDHSDWAGPELTCT